MINENPNIEKHEDNLEVVGQMQSPRYRKWLKLTALVVVFCFTVTQFNLKAFAQEDVYAQQNEYQPYQSTTTIPQGYNNYYNSYQPSTNSYNNLNMVTYNYFTIQNTPTINLSIDVDQIAKMLPVTSAASPDMNFTKADINLDNIIGPSTTFKFAPDFRGGFVSCGRDNFALTKIDTVEFNTILKNADIKLDSLELKDANKTFACTQLGLFIILDEANKLQAKITLNALDLSNLSLDKLLSSPNSGLNLTQNDKALIQDSAARLGFNTKTQNVTIETLSSFKGKEGDFIVINLGVGEKGRGNLVIDTEERTATVDVTNKQFMVTVTAKIALSGYSDEKLAGKLLEVKAQGSAYYIGKLLEGIDITKNNGSFSEIIKHVANKEEALKIFFGLQDREYVTAVLQVKANGAYEVVSIKNTQGNELLAKAAQTKIEIAVQGPEFKDLNTKEFAKAYKADTAWFGSNAPDAKLGDTVTSVRRMAQKDGTILYMDAKEPAGVQGQGGRLLALVDPTNKTITIYGNSGEKTVYTTKPTSETPVAKPAQSLPAVGNKETAGLTYEARDIDGTTYHIGYKNDKVVDAYYEGKELAYGEMTLKEGQDGRIHFKPKTDKNGQTSFIPAVGTQYVDKAGNVYEVTALTENGYNAKPVGGHFKQSDLSLGYGKNGMLRIEGEQEYAYKNGEPVLAGKIAKLETKDGAKTVELGEGQKVNAGALFVFTADNKIVPYKATMTNEETDKDGKLVVVLQYENGQVASGSMARTKGNITITYTNIEKTAEGIKPAEGSKVIMTVSAPTNRMIELTNGSTVVENVPAGNYELKGNEWVRADGQPSGITYSDMEIKQNGTVTRYDKVVRTEKGFEPVTKGASSSETEVSKLKTQTPDEITLGDNVKVAVLKDEKGELKGYRVNVEGKAEVTLDAEGRLVKAVFNNWSDTQSIKAAQKALGLEETGIIDASNADKLTKWSNKVNEILKTADVKKAIVAKSKETLLAAWNTKYAASQNDNLLNRLPLVGNDNHQIYLDKNTEYENKLKEYKEAFGEYANTLSDAGINSEIDRIRSPKYSVRPRDGKTAALNAEENKLEDIQVGILQTVLNDRKAKGARNDYDSNAGVIGPVLNKAKQAMASAAGIATQAAPDYDSSIKAAFTNGALAKLDPKTAELTKSLQIGGIVFDKDTKFLLVGDKWIPAEGTKAVLVASINIGTLLVDRYNGKTISSSNQMPIAIGKDGNILLPKEGCQATGAMKFEDIKVTGRFSLTDGKWNSAGKIKVEGFVISEHKAGDKTEKFRANVVNISGIAIKEYSDRVIHTYFDENKTPVVDVVYDATTGALKGFEKYTNPPQAAAPEQEIVPLANAAAEVKDGKLIFNGFTFGDTVLPIAGEGGKSPAGKSESRFVVLKQLDEKAVLAKGLVQYKESSPMGVLTYGSQYLVGSETGLSLEIGKDGEKVKFSKEAFVKVNRRNEPVLFNGNSEVVVTEKTATKEAPAGTKIIATVHNGLPARNLYIYPGGKQETVAFKEAQVKNEVVYAYDITNPYATAPESYFKSTQTYRDQRDSQGRPIATMRTARGESIVNRKEGNNPGDYTTLVAVKNGETTVRLYDRKLNEDGLYTLKRVVEVKSNDVNAGLWETRHPVVTQAPVAKKDYIFNVYGTAEQTSYTFDYNEDGSAVIARADFGANYDTSKTFGIQRVVVQGTAKDGKQFLFQGGFFEDKPSDTLRNNILQSNENFEPVCIGGILTREFDKKGRPASAYVVGEKGNIVQYGVAFTYGKDDELISGPVVMRLDRQDVVMDYAAVKRINDKKSELHDENVAYLKASLTGHNAAAGWLADKTVAGAVGGTKAVTRGFRDAAGVIYGLAYLPTLIPGVEVDTEAIDKNMYYIVEYGHESGWGHKMKAYDEKGAYIWFDSQAAFDTMAAASTVAAPLAIGRLGFGYTAAGFTARQAALDLAKVMVFWGTANVVLSYGMHKMEGLPYSFGEGARDFGKGAVLGGIFRVASVGSFTASTATAATKTMTAGTARFTATTAGKVLTSFKTWALVGGVGNVCVNWYINGSDYSFRRGIVDFGKGVIIGTLVRAAGSAFMGRAAWRVSIQNGINAVVKTPYRSTLIGMATFSVIDPLFTAAGNVWAGLDNWAIGKGFNYKFDIGVKGSENWSLSRKMAYSSLRGAQTGMYMGTILRVLMVPYTVYGEGGLAQAIATAPRSRVATLFRAIFTRDLTSLVKNNLETAARIRTQGIFVRLSTAFLHNVDSAIVFTGFSSAVDSTLKGWGVPAGIAQQIGFLSFFLFPSMGNSATDPGTGIWGQYKLWKAEGKLGKIINLSELSGKDSSLKNLIRIARAEIGKVITLENKNGRLSVKITPELSKVANMRLEAIRNVSAEINELKIVKSPDAKTEATVIDARLNEAELRLRILKGEIGLASEYKDAQSALLDFIKKAESERLLGDKEEISRQIQENENQLSKYKKEKASPEKITALREEKKRLAGIQKSLDRAMKALDKVEDPSTLYRYNLEHYSYARMLRENGVESLNKELILNREKLGEEKFKQGQEIIAELKQLQSQIDAEQRAKLVGTENNRQSGSLTGRLNRIYDSYRVALNSAFERFNGRTLLSETATLKETAQVRDRICQDVFGRGWSELTFIEQLAFSRRLVQEFIGAEKFIEDQWSLQEVMVIANRAGMIGSLKTSAGKSIVYTVVFGMLASKGKLNGELLVSRSGEETKFLGEYQPLARALGFEYKNGSEVWESRQGLDSLSSRMNRGGNKVFVYNLDARGFLGLEAVDSNSKVFRRVNARCIDEGDVAALMQKAFKIAATTTASERMVLDVRKAIGSTEEIRYVPSAEFEAATAPAYTMRNGRPIINDAAFEHLKSQGYSIERKTTKLGIEAGGKDSGLISNTLRARWAYGVMTGNVIGFKDGEAYVIENGEAQIGTKDNSNVYNVAVTLLKNMKATRILISTGGSEAALSQIFSRKGVNVITFGGSATMDVAKEIAKATYASGVIDIEGSYLNPKSFRIVSTAELKESGKTEIDFAAEKASEAINTRTTRGNGNRGALVGIYEAKPEQISRLVARIVEIETVKKGGSLEDIKSDISAIIRAFEGSAETYKTLEDLTESRSISQRTRQILGKIRIIDAYRPSDRGKDGKGPKESIEDIANEGQGRITITNQRGFRAFNFRGEINEVLINTERTPIGLFLQGLGRVKRAGAEGDRYVVVDEAKINEVLERVRVIGEFLGGPELLFADKNLQGLYTKYIKDPSSLKPFEKLELALNFSALEQKSMSVRFKIANEASSKVLREPLQSMIHRAKRTTDRLILEQALRDVLEERSKEADLFGYEKLMTPEQIAQNEYAQSLRYALKIYAELANSNLSKGFKYEIRTRIADILNNGKISEAKADPEKSFAQAPIDRPAEYVIQVVKYLSNYILPSESTTSSLKESKKSAIVRNIDREVSSVKTKADIDGAKQRVAVIINSNSANILTKEERDALLAYAETSMEIYVNNKKLRAHLKNLEPATKRLETLKALQAEHGESAYIYYEGSEIKVGKKFDKDGKLTSMPIGQAIKNLELNIGAMKAPGDRRYNAWQRLMNMLGWRKAREARITDYDQATVDKHSTAILGEFAIAQKAKMDTDETAKSNLVKALSIIRAFAKKLVDKSNGRLTQENVERAISTIVLVDMPARIRLEDRGVDGSRMGAYYFMYQGEVYTIFPKDRLDPSSDKYESHLADLLHEVAEIALRKTDGNLSEDDAHKEAMVARKEFLEDRFISGNLAQAKAQANKEPKKTPALEVKAQTKPRIDEPVAQNPAKDEPVGIKPVAGVKGQPSYSLTDPDVEVVVTDDARLVVKKAGNIVEEIRLAEAEVVSVGEHAIGLEDKKTGKFIVIFDNRDESENKKAAEAYRTISRNPKAKGLVLGDVSVVKCDVKEQSGAHAILKNWLMSLAEKNPKAASKLEAVMSLGTLYIAIKPKVTMAADVLTEKDAALVVGGIRLLIKKLYDAGIYLDGENPSSRDLFNNIGIVDGNLVYTDLANLTLVDKDKLPMEEVNIALNKILEVAGIPTVPMPKLDELEKQLNLDGLRQL